MRRLTLVAIAAVLLVACNSTPPPVAAQTPSAAATTTTAVPRPDPGIDACKSTAKRQREKTGDTPLPTITQRRASWERYQRSGYRSLREVGEKLERAWTGGNLGDQLEAGVTLVVVCATYGVEIEVG